MDMNAGKIGEKMNQKGGELKEAHSSLQPPLSHVWLNKGGDLFWVYIPIWSLVGKW